MRKLLGLAVAGALLVSALPAKAEVLKNLKTNGSLEVLGVMANHVNYNSDGAANPAPGSYRNTQPRVIFGMNWDLLDNLHANLTFVKNNRYYGQGSEDLNTVQTNVKIEEANIVMDNLFTSWQAKIGRQFYNPGHKYIVYYGPSMRETLPVSSIDAMRFDREHELLGVANNLTAIWAKQSSGGPSTTDVDQNFVGLVNTMKLNDVTNVGVLAYNNRTGNNDTRYDGRNLWIVGAQAKTEMFGFAGSVDAAMNMGRAAMVANQKTPSYKGYAFIANLGYKLDMGFGMFNPRGMFAYGTGGEATANVEKDTNFYGINPTFRPGEIFGNRQAGAYNADYTFGQLGNLTVINVGLDYKHAAWEKWNFMVDGYTFALNKIKTAGKKNKPIGSEIDLKANYQYAENVGICFGLSQFYPGARVIEDNKNANMGVATKASTYINVKWGS